MGRAKIKFFLATGAVALLAAFLVYFGHGVDPRGEARVRTLVEQRESDSFRARLGQGLGAGFSLPGLRSAQVSWTWLELTQGIHTESSFQGDFSWLFSKLYFVAQKAHPKERRFLTNFASFFMVLGKDPIGTSIIMQEMISRNPDYYNTWFWSGYHAVENLGDLKMASDFFKRASSYEQAGSYLVPLAYRLSKGYKMSDDELLDLANRELPVEIRNLIREAIRNKPPPAHEGS